MTMLWLWVRVVQKRGLYEVGDRVRVAGEGSLGFLVIRDFPVWHDALQLVILPVEPRLVQLSCTRPSRSSELH